MIGTRTLPSSSRALPLVVATGSSGKLLADVQDALDDREPRRHGERADRPRQAAPRGKKEPPDPPGRPPQGRKDEPRGDEHHALGAGAQADVSLEPESLGAGARVRDEE